MVLVVLCGESEPIFVAREIDDRAARITTWMSERNVECYLDDYARGGQPIDWVAKVVRERGHDADAAGAELQSKHLSPELYERLTRTFAAVEDAPGLVDELYRVKSSGEIDLIRRAGSITDRTIRTATEVIADGVRENDAMAEIVRPSWAGQTSSAGACPR